MIKEESGCWMSETWDCPRGLRSWPRRRGHPSGRGVEVLNAANRPKLPTAPRTPCNGGLGRRVPQGAARPLLTTGLTAQAAPVRCPPRPRLSSPRPPHGLYSAYALSSRFARRRRLMRGVERMPAGSGGDTVGLGCPGGGQGRLSVATRDVRYPHPSPSPGRRGSLGSFMGIGTRAEGSGPGPR